MSIVKLMQLIKILCIRCIFIIDMAMHSMYNAFVSLINTRVSMEYLNDMQILEQQIIDELNKHDNDVLNGLYKELNSEIEEDIKPFIEPYNNDK